MASKPGKFQFDSVVKFTPISFAGEFTRKMRTIAGLANIPSVRTTIAIPRFLTARYFRKETLDPMDYFEAAVYNTPYEDQEIAKKVARELLFPKQVKRERRQQKKVEVEDQSKLSGIDLILNELDEAGFDDLLEAMSEEVDLEDMLEEQDQSWGFMDELIESSDPKDQARLQLLEELNSDFAIVQHALNTRTLVDNFLESELGEQAGSWSPQVFQPSITLGMGDILRRQSQMPWEVATAMGMTRDPGYQKYMDDTVDIASPEALGSTMKYHNENQVPLEKNWVEKAFSRIKTMRDYYGLLQGLDQYRDPPPHAVEHGAEHEIRESLDIAQTIDRQHGTDLGDELFEKFQEKHPQPTLDQVQDATYEDGNDSWESMLKDSVSREKQGMDQHQLSELAKQIGNHKSSRMSPKMQQTQNSLAKDVATENLEKVDKMDAFLPELDHMISNKLIPDIERTMNAGRKLGVSEEDILERYNSPVKVLESYIASDLKDKQRYDSIVRKIDNVNPMQMNKMMADAAKNDNQMAMAALGAADLGQAMTSAQSMQMADGSSAQDILAQAIDKSIGGGTNLLKQWFMHRRNLPKPIKDKLRDMMRKTLLEIGMEWANKGTGSSEEGIIPVTDTRPYRDGDELDLIDIEATLSSLIMSGKQLNQMTTDELMVTETSKGKTSLGVLIDISGSMSGQNLAMCAVSVVMLLGKLDQKEVAIALFESNTHKIKGFEDETTLDKVADELLDLEARGGTRADSALRWIGNEFNTVTSSDVKILFFLSDYYLSENTEALTKLMEPMIHEGVKILGAYHGNYDRRRMEHMVNMMDGSSLKITNFEKLPESISDAIASITE